MHTFIHGDRRSCTENGNESEESPPEQEEHNEPDAGKGSVLRQSQRLESRVVGRSPYLLNQQLPIDAHSRPSIFLAVLSKST